MQIGILGFPKVGKTTLFNILTASHQVTDKLFLVTADGIAPYAGV